MLALFNGKFLEWLRKAKTCGSVLNNQSIKMIDWLLKIRSEDFQVLFAAQVTLGGLFLSKVVETVKQVVKPILAKHSFYLFDVAFVKEKGGWYLRVYIDKDGGVTIDDCVLVSDELGEKLDEMEPDPIPQAYFLEVSSPGAERPLRNDEELRQAVGEYVNLSLYKNLNGNKSFEGTLKSVTEDQVVLENDQWGKHPTVAIPRDLIAKARLAIKF